MAAPVLGLALSLAACGGGDRLPAFTAENRPNVLIVLVDVLRRDHLGAYGYELPTSPNIDAFAAEAVLFEEMYSHSTWTKPSVATLFTSVYSDQHGLGRIGFEEDAGFHTDVLPERLETAAELFRQGGYRTASFGANVHIQQKTGFGQGFESFFMKRLTTAFELNRRLEAWLAESTDERPFFAYLHYMDVHWPYDRRIRGDTRVFGPTNYKKRPPETWSLVASWAEKNLDEHGLSVLTARYDREISYVDKAFGELMAWFEEQGRLDDTLVVFVGDHGEGLYEHGFLQHTFAPYPEVTGVPLILRLPPVFEVTPGRSAAVVGLVDVLPTLLDLVDLPAPSQVQGRSLVPLVLGDGLRERPAYSDGDGVRAMRSSRHTVFLDAEGGQRCFERASDPMELAPLADLPEACTRMAQALTALVRGFESQGGEPGTTVEFNAEEIEELKALGYLD